MIFKKPLAANHRPGCISPHTTLGIILAVSLNDGALASGNFEGPAGIQGRWAMEVTTGISVRTKKPDPQLISNGNGGKAANESGDDNNLNYKKGDIIASSVQALGELDLTSGDSGLFLRAKAYSDPYLKSKKLPHGSANNNYVPNQDLKSSGFEPSSKLEDIELLDNYFYTNQKILSKALGLRVGTQVVTWGEGLFIFGGVNQYSNFNAAALSKPGAQLKEIFQPIPQIALNLQASENITVESFIHLNHEKVTVPGCGTYFSPADSINCNMSGGSLNPGIFALGPAQLDFTGYNDQQNFNGGGTVVVNGVPVNTSSTSGLSPLTSLVGGITGLPTDLSKLNFHIRQLNNREPGDKGQFGISTRYFSPETGAEFGAYFANYSQRIPNLGLAKIASNYEGSVYNGLQVGGNYIINPTSYFIDYGKQNIKVAGLSVSTSVAGYTVAGEISYTKGYPVAYNANDYSIGVILGQGPLAELGDNTKYPLGSIVNGYKPLDKVQIQSSFIKAFPRFMGAETMLLVGEIGAQFWKGIEDTYTGVRYGRAATFGTAVHTSYGNGTCERTVNINSDYCAPEGFATKTSMGYRLLSVFSYPDLVRGVSISPKLFLSHDFKGFSADGIFVEDRVVIGLGMRADFKSGKYFIEGNYTAFNPKAKYDVQRDKSFVSVVAGTSL